MRQLARLDIERLGHTVVAEAADGPETLDMAALHSPDVVLLDWHMPGGIDGAALTTELRHRCPDVKVIVYSASLDPQTWQKAMASNVSAFVEKGDLEELGPAFESCAETS